MARRLHYNGQTWSHLRPTMPRIVDMVNLLHKTHSTSCNGMPQLGILNVRVHYCYNAYQPTGCRSSESADNPGPGSRDVESANTAPVIIQQAVCVAGGSTDASNTTLTPHGVDALRGGKSERQTVRGHAAILKSQVIFISLLVQSGRLGDANFSFPGSPHNCVVSDVFLQTLTTNIITFIQIGADAKPLSVLLIDGGVRVPYKRHNPYPNLPLDSPTRCHALRKYLVNSFIPLAKVTDIGCCHSATLQDSSLVTDYAPET
ncbi:uncharacterized protein BCR38DRAFT_410878 [Pseudomassariella vexata]|uniref:Uncharacterized protein n=1 Tax=Pseudomassariella vexata TaxID=1141098 RepID=A0A1Y2DTH5_9PEZI|nr:uncharacterized protein BCR38DRAFT_410878 [Pseudomassariella vexata]ORY62469.1 hypothetical protein BCR38DRAFT_410878 [Pseudomassariella vexata]